MKKLLFFYYDRYRNYGGISNNFAELYEIGDDDIFMWTGVYDKNNTPIFEGNVVTGSNGDYMEIKNAVGGFYAETTVTEKVFPLWNNYFTAENRWEVVGHITTHMYDSESDTYINMESREE